MDLSRQGASFDMHHDLFRSIRDLDLRSNFNLTFQGHITRYSIHLDEKHTAWSIQHFFGFSLPIIVLELMKVF